MAKIRYNIDSTAFVSFIAYAVCVTYKSFERTFYVNLAINMFIKL